MRTIAFYLPQFHAIPENDEWWGPGFTEWVNVRRAEPQFDGHDHPRRPDLLGEYSLLDPAIHQRQSQMAREHGIDAFCMYFYWFDGQRLLETPTDMWRDTPHLLPYCLSWANESWTRRWDGKEHDILAGQRYGPGYEAAIFADLLAHFRAPHYLRQDGKPVLLVHRVDLIPDAKSFARVLRDLAVEAGLDGLYLVASETKHGLNSNDFGFDAVAEFPPVGSNTLGAAQIRPVPGLAKGFRGRLMSYQKLVNAYTSRRSPNFIRHRGVMPGWDNTARRGVGATIYVGSTPALYSAWIERARQLETSERGEDGLVFINAWNEWAEGAYLEPDATHGTSYLRATRGDRVELASRASRNAGDWSLGHLRSLGLVIGSTVLKHARMFRSSLSRARTARTR